MSVPSEESEEEQEADEDGEPAQRRDMAYLHENVAETTFAVDPVHHAGPFRMMQAPQGTLQALQEQAAGSSRPERGCDHGCTGSSASCRSRERSLRRSKRQRKTESQRSGATWPTCKRMWQRPRLQRVQCLMPVPSE